MACSCSIDRAPSANYSHWDQCRCAAMRQKGAAAGDGTACSYGGYETDLHGCCMYPRLGGKVTGSYRSTGSFACVQLSLMLC